MIETVDEIRHFYQLTGAEQSSYPPKKPIIRPNLTNKMELLIVFLIGLLITIFVLPFVAIAKANAAKRSIEDLLARLSSVEDDLLNLRQQTGAPVKPAAPATAPKPEAVPPPLPVTTPAPIMA